ncbi:MAG: hypothetical protein DRI61_08030 [Chloroflexi bacterium]|nr:MAG: hypothetical protein DRI61_08030 [Chloroflexota bacterium]
MKDKIMMLSDKDVKALCADPNDQVAWAQFKADGSILLVTGAKLYTVRGGLRRISGYADNGRDLEIKKDK